MEKKLSKETKTITILQLADVINLTTAQAQLNFWQKASDYQKGLIENLKEIGIILN